MKKILLSLLCLLCLYGFSFAQKAPIKWKDVDKEELQMKIYPHDSSAAAVVLADYGVAYFTFNSDKGFRLNLDRHTRIKILNKNGLDYANQQIALYHKGSSKQEVRGLKGITYNLKNGRIQKDKMDKKEVFTEAYNEHVNIEKFTLPNVKEGSVIEFKYTLQSDFIYNLFTWEFQRDIPVQWSEFRAKVPEYFSYKNFMGGFHPLTLAETQPYKDSFQYTYRETVAANTSFSGRGTREKQSVDIVKPNGVAYRWAIEKVPAIKEEKYITTVKDYLSRIEFELNYTKYPGQTLNHYSSSWEKLGEEFNKDPRFGGQLEKDRYLREVIPSLQEKASGTELISLIVQYVQQNFHYNGKERVYTENSLKKVFDAKEGNAAEINLLLTLMLREAGFNANPVILSTRSHGIINPVIPLEKDFNYVVVHVALREEAVLLDATEAGLPVGMLPFRCLNQQGRLIAENSTDWVSLLSNELIKKASQTNVTLSVDGGLSGTLILKHEGYPAIQSRKKLEEKGEEKYLEEEYKEKGWTVNGFSIEDEDSTGSELTENVSFEAQNMVTVAGDKMYFQPLLRTEESENPFKLEKRNFPVDFGCPMETLSMAKIKLPEGYAVEEIPEQMVLTLPDKSGTFRYMVNQVGDELTVINSLKFAKPMYLPEEYPALKKFYELVIAKQAEQVVLMKIN